jgi:hypothetical protein
MPICDGVEATKRLRNLEAKRKAQVILPSMILFQRASPLITNFCRSCCFKCRLSRFYQTTLPQCGNERIFQQTATKK